MEKIITKNYTHLIHFIKMYNKSKICNIFFFFVKKLSIKKKNKVQDVIC